MMQISISFSDPIRGLTGESQTGYWIMGTGDNEALVELAVDSIPAPGALALLGLGLLGAGSRRRTAAC